MYFMTSKNLYCIKKMCYLRLMLPLLSYEHKKWTFLVHFSAVVGKPDITDRNAHV